MCPRAKTRASGSRARSKNKGLAFINIPYALTRRNIINFPYIESCTKFRSPGCQFNCFPSLLLPTATINLVPLSFPPRCHAAFSIATPFSPCTCLKKVERQRLESVKRSLAERAQLIRAECVAHPPPLTRTQINAQEAAAVDARLSAHYTTQHLKQALKDILYMPKNNISWCIVPKVCNGFFLCLKKTYPGV